MQDCFIKKFHWKKIIFKIYLIKIIHNDLSERQLIMNDNEEKYWILFINDYIYFSYVILLKIKDEVFSIFKHFLSFHE